MVRQGFSYIIFTLLFTLGVTALDAQNYAQPLDAKNPQFSSNFGNIRGTRFHAGVDYRTGGAEGVKIFAAQDGYIYRIGIKPYGYGKVLYIAHPNGMQTVYAHLRDFTPEIEEYVKAERYKRRENSVDIFLNKKTFTVKKGQLIGYSGNTGSSTGPHLHFEVRDAATNRSLNLVARGYLTVEDNIPPEVFAVSYYTVDTLMGVPCHRLAARYKAVEIRKGSYALETPVKAPGRGYFAVESIDYKDANRFRMSLYRIVMRVDGARRFEYLMDGIDYSQVGLSKTAVQYVENLRSKNDIYRLAVQDGATGFPFYGYVANNGLINPAADKEVEITLDDDNGNRTELKFSIEYAPELYGETLDVPVDCDALDFKRGFTKSFDGLMVTIPAGALFESIFYKQGLMAEAPRLEKQYDGAVVSPFYEINSAETPLKSGFTISIDADVAAEYRGKVVLAMLASGKSGAYRLSCVPAKYADGKVTGQAWTFGKWCAAVDAAAPVVTPSFKSGSDLSKAKSISFGVSDNLSGISSYNAEIDGKWVILEYDTVKGRLTHVFDDALTGLGREHSITLTVADKVGNITSHTSRYYR